MESADVCLLYQDSLPELLSLFTNEPNQQRVINWGKNEDREGTCCSLIGNVLMNLIKIKIRKTSMTTSTLEKLQPDPKAEQPREERGKSTMPQAPHST